MMQLYAALILSVTLSAACGLRCYTCYLSDPKSCIDTTTCTFGRNRCGTLTINALNVSKGCLLSQYCADPIACCEGDLCNSAIPTGPRAIVLLVSSAILKFIF
ncbi:lymphocyte antigen 6G-like [Oreochromis niloticus]|uniref:lymphocyte antigen 6G-like n=1 Tax=Oreochromis niloticus TaxID=8128 RepID=UPI0009047E40|nr:lymphocyte antigen 6G-like [Oreochromis niloticus]